MKREVKYNTRKSITTGTKPPKQQKQQGKEQIVYKTKIVGRGAKEEQLYDIGLF